MRFKIPSMCCGARKYPLRFGLFLGSGLIAAVLALPDIAAGQIVDWSNTTGATDPWFQIGTNWTGNVAPGAGNTARFNQAGTYDVWWDATTAATIPNVSGLNFSSGDVTFSNQDLTTQHGLSAFPSIAVTGAATRFTNRGLHLQTTDTVLNGGTITLDGSHAQGSKLTTDNLSVELGGEFRVESGATSTSNFTRLANGGTSTGTLTVTGAGSQHTATDSLFVGLNGTGILNVEAGGVVNSGGAYIGTYQGSGTATVTGSGSQFNTGGIYIAGKSTVGTPATGSLTIADNATVTATAFTRLWDSGATVTLDGGNLTTGSFLNTGGGTFNFNDGTLTVDGGTFSPGTSGDFYLNGNTASALPRLVLANSATSSLTGNLTVGDGANQAEMRVESGSTSTSNITRIARYGGASTGTLTVTGAGSQHTATDSIFVGLEGTGILNVEAGGVVNASGAYIGGAFNANGTATVTGSGSQLNTTGIFIAGNSTSGTPATGSLTIADNATVTATAFTRLWDSGATVTLDGGNLTTGDLISTDGTINGYGNLTASGTITNQGTMSFSGGSTNVMGTVNNGTGGQIISSGSSVTTFHGDVTHNGTEIRTDSGSGLVFLSDYTGAGIFTGNGNVQFEGDFRPGNSPAVVDFAGDVTLGTLSQTFIELGGLNSGEFDMLNIAGNMTVAGSLNVSLWNGFTLSDGMEFVFANRFNGTGRFVGLNEGELVGTLGGEQLYISYLAGDGNDLSLFTSSVPEPTSALMFGLSIGLLSIPRRRRRQADHSCFVNCPREFSIGRH